MSARIEDVLAEHRTWSFNGTDIGCACDKQMRSSAQQVGHVGIMLREAGFGDVAQARKDALLEAAERVRGFHWGSMAAGYLQGMAAPRAEDSPARPEAGGEASSPGVWTPTACEDCGEIPMQNACTHDKVLCGDCRPGLCHGCQADSAELCGDATKAGDVP